MSDAAERYVKVFTASRLLRWSIDRYREEKQGPMLARASAIFGQLTLNSFERLRVDFDRHPMVLEGQRADGHCVGIEGLRDGTRDKLRSEERRVGEECVSLFKHRCQPSN